MDVRSTLGAIRAWLWLIILAVVLSGTLSYFVSKSLVKTYEATSMLIIGTVSSSANQDYSNLLASQALAKTYGRLLTSKTVLESALRELNLDQPTASQLEKMVSVDLVRDTQIMVLKVRSENPATAANLANAIAAQLIDKSPASPQGNLGADMAFVQMQMKDLETQITTIQNRLKELKSRTPVLTTSTSAIATGDEIIALEDKLRSAQDRYGNLLNAKTRVSNNYVSVVESAVEPTLPISPNTTTNVLLAVLLGLFLSIGFAFVVEYFDDRIKTPEALGALVNEPVFGVISRIRIKDQSHGLVAQDFPKSSASEDFRSLRASIQFARPDQPLHKIVVSSCDPADGKSFVAANLAISMAQAGVRVVLIDADLRRPTLHTLFNLPNQSGLTSLLAGRTRQVRDVVQPTSEENLLVLTSGPIPPNPSELLTSKRFENLLEHMSGAVELTIIDSPPILAVADSLIVSTKVDGLLLVVNLAKTRVKSLKKAISDLNRVNGKLLGFVINKDRTANSTYYRGYYTSDAVADNTSTGSQGPESATGNLAESKRSVLP